METKYLKDIGLSDIEINIYLALLKEEDCLASELSKNTGINRTLTYQILNKLISRGIVSYVIKNNTKYFRAANPGKILDFLTEKEANIRKIIPELMSIKSPQRKTYSVELYEGKEGLKTVLNEVLRLKPKEFLDMTSGMTVVVLPRFWMDQWNSKREKIIPSSRFLYNETKIGVKRANEMKNYRNTKVKLMSKGLESPSHIYTYGDNVGITLWEKDDPFAIVIHSKEVAGRFKEFFEWFWKMGKEV